MDYTSKPMRTTSLLITWLSILILILPGCQEAQTGEDILVVRVIADGNSYTATVPRGTTVLAAVESVSLSIAQLDQVNPPTYSILTEETEIIITRILEEYETRLQVIPYDRQEISNESMSAGESRLIQSGKNGVSEIVVRHLYENGILTTETIVSETVTSYPLPEIIMVGVKNPFTPVSITGRIVYLTSGNAWIMENSSANRRPLITSGDLDGRIFSLSPDGEWLLFSRGSLLPGDEGINNLWTVNTTGTPQPINLNVSNVIHFADWQPGKYYTIAYSTVEPRSTAPGWQANNDLYLLPFNPGTRKAGAASEILASSSGGVYGWWGTTFLWSQDGTQIAYARPDEIGLVDIENQALVPLLDITPFNTYADWAWIPGLAWGSDMNSLFFIAHALPTDLTSPEDSPYFDLQAISLSTKNIVTLVPGVGMFSYPVAQMINQAGAENGYQIACLAAIFPAQSTTSRYRVLVMDNDGSEQRTIFPADTLTGITPQLHWGAWSPEGITKVMAVLYEGNLWIIDNNTQRSQQITGDGLTSKIDWK